jgi:hypothetical protein
MTSLLTPCRVRTFLLLAAATLAAAGCGAQQLLLGTQGSYLFTAQDALALPGEEVQLKARLQGGDMLRGEAGYVVRFSRGGSLYKAAQTDSDGVATVSFTPDAAGDFVFDVDVAPAGFPDKPPPPADILIACRAADAPLAVVDLDKTVVASGFETVLMGNPTPMARSPEVLERMARDRTIVYLTHRPEYFGPKSEAWLREHKFPRGPLLMSTASGFFKGSGAFKTEMIRGLKARFTKIELGIGDKASDVQAYHDNGLRGILIIQVDEKAAAENLEAQADALAPLPDAVQVVTGWDEVEQILFGGKAFPRSAMEKRLRDLAAARQKAEPAGKS